MRKFRLKLLSVMLSACMLPFGCSEQKKVSALVAPAVVAAPDQPSSPEKVAEPSGPQHSPALTATESKPVNPDVGVSVVEKTPDQKPVVTTETSKDAAKPDQKAVPFAEAAYLPEGVVGLFVVHPKQFVGSPIGSLVNEYINNDDDSEYYHLMKRTGIKLGDVERITIIVDQTQINMFAQQSGLPVAAVAAAEGPAEAMQHKNSLKQIGLAFHNYHDVFQRFPRADGDGTGQHTGLSWRVHLLPFLDQAPLYNQFHFDEAWDSDHNKTLIAQMPALFKSPGVKDEGKTAFHVFTGENTLFHGEQGLAIRDVTDGTSNTILAVLAASDTAEIWTKPGGLEVDFNSPKKVLGDLTNDERILVLVADGSVRAMQTNLDDTQLANLIKPADGNVVDFGPQVPVNEALPSAIVVLGRDVTQADLVKGVLGEATEETHEGQAFHKNPQIAVWQPDSRTVVAGPTETVKKIISAKQTGKAIASPLIEQLQLSADFTAAIDMEPQSSLLGFFAQGNPMMGMVTNIKTVTNHVSATAKEGDSLVEINVMAFDEAMAGGLFAMASVWLIQVKNGMSQLAPPPNASASDKEMQALIKNIVASSTIRQDGDKIQLRVPTPKGFDRVSQLLKPALVEVKAWAKETQQRNTFRKLGLAFHNFHDTMARLPGAGRNREQAPVGLSWRVHLLPYLDQAPLYSQFKLDEPWDSEHNKKLIEKMPLIFQSPGVDDPGKTTVHVFTGPGAPFANDKTPGFREFTDGLSVTILAVLAGPETADVWTRPGGLDFDPDDPIKSLGIIPGKTILAVFADGAVREFDKEIDAAILRRWIQIADNEPVETP
jgi:Protein of unknown function (DUF1559)